MSNHNLAGLAKVHVKLNAVHTGILCTVVERDHGVLRVQLTVSTMPKDQDLTFTPTLLKNAVHVVLHREALRFHATIYPKRTRNAILHACNLTTKPYST